MIKSRLLSIYLLEVVRIVNSQHLFRLGNQTEGVALAVMNNISEAQSCQSRRDLIHKLKLAHKELREAESLSIHFTERNGVPSSWKQTIDGLLDELGRLMSSSISTAVRNQQRPPKTR
ncbi:MAG: four helix bundle protein [Ignavibacteria bacterium]|nr:four helix bundle protein [Ignavibacteria bacterium]MBK7412117.1 four helix bundle protein [Ignavibacteria bacterium]MBP7093683.1 four helix bundle protein [Candidatus Kapabacteria bacterium]